MEKPTGKKNKSRTPEAEVHVQKDTAKEEKASGKEQPNQSPTLAQKHRKEAHLSPENEEHMCEAFDASFKGDFEGVLFTRFQRKKPYERSECGRIFKHKTDHVRHRVHTGEKPFQCAQCRKTFRHSSDVTKPRRSHTREKPCKCSECGKAFNCSSNLLNQKTHTGEKPHGCKECGKTFTYSPCLIRHQKHHPRKKR
ncbi:LOW QUALITY PROTEIN: zinc finger protein 41 homolog [Dama dama]